MHEIDVAVVGGGPAGLSAAGWLGRYRRATVVFDTGEYRNRWVDKVHGFLSAIRCRRPRCSPPPAMTSTSTTV